MRQEGRAEFRAFTSLLRSLRNERGNALDDLEMAEIFARATGVWEGDETDYNVGINLSFVGLLSLIS